MQRRFLPNEPTCNDQYILSYDVFESILVADFSATSDVILFHLHTSVLHRRCVQNDILWPGRHYRRANTINHRLTSSLLPSYTLRLSSTGYSGGGHKRSNRRLLFHRKRFSLVTAPCSDRWASRAFSDTFVRLHLVMNTTLLEVISL